MHKLIFTVCPQSTDIKFSHNLSIIEALEDEGKNPHTGESKQNKAAACQLN